MTRFYRYFKAIYEGGRHWYELNRLGKKGRLFGGAHATKKCVTRLSLALQGAYLQYTLSTFLTFPPWLERRCPDLFLSSLSLHTTET